MMTREEKQEVLKVFRLMLENESVFINGLCGWCSRMLLKNLINEDEFLTAKIYLDERLPPRMDNSAYCWEIGDIAPRIEWIKQQIVKLENNAQ